MRERSRAHLAHFRRKGLWPFVKEFFIALLNLHSGTSGYDAKTSSSLHFVSDSPNADPSDISQRYEEHAPETVETGTQENRASACNALITGATLIASGRVPYTVIIFGVAIRLLTLQHIRRGPAGPAHHNISLIHTSRRPPCPGKRFHDRLDCNVRV